MKLIINADDAGVDLSRNRGIFEAASYGVVTSVSVMVGRAGWDDACALLRKQPSVGAGLHFNLTAGSAHVRGYTTLTHRDGCFFEKGELFRRAVSGLIDAREVAREFKAQLSLFQKTGREPSHIDGHHHVHVLPGVREALNEVVPAGAWVRLPWERAQEIRKPAADDCPNLFGHRENLIGALNYFSREAQQYWAGRFRHVDDFGGTPITFRLSLRVFMNTVGALRGSVCELMCHPGSEPEKDAAGFSRRADRQQERDILLSREFAEFLASNNMELVSYRDLS